MAKHGETRRPNAPFPEHSWRYCSQVSSPQLDANEDDDEYVKHDEEGDNPGTAPGPFGTTVLEG